MDVPRINDDNINEFNILLSNEHRNIRNVNFFFLEACRNDSPIIVSTLLDTFPHGLLSIEYGFYIACIKNNDRIIELLIDCNIEYDNYLDYNVYQFGTPMLNFCLNNKSIYVRALLYKGISIVHNNFECFKIAINYCFLEVIDAFFDYPFEWINIFNPIVECIYTGNKKVLEYILLKNDEYSRNLLYKSLIKYMYDINSLCFLMINDFVNLEVFNIIPQKNGGHLLKYNLSYGGVTIFENSMNECEILKLDLFGYTIYYYD